MWYSHFIRPLRNRGVIGKLAMSIRLNLRFATAGALAIAALSFPAFVSAASEHTVATSEFSAQNKEDPKNKNKGAGAPKNGPQGQPHNAARVERHATPQGGGQKHIKAKKEVKKNINIQNKNAPAGGTGGPKSAHKVFTPRGAKSHTVTAARIHGVPARGVGRTAISGRTYSVWRSGYRVRRGGNWRTFVALGTLGAITIGAAEYYPYAYIEAPQDYCDGMTEDGCQLVYDEVETMEGDAVGQCVAYCPWR
jgi:hypothetical protein